MQFLTRADVQSLNDLRYLEQHSMASASSLWSQACEIPRLDTRLPLRQFLRRHKKHRAVIISAETGIGKLPFDITPEMIANLQSEAALAHCLCRPEHGTNFQNRPADTSDANLGIRSKRYCLWQLPLFATVILGNATEAMTYTNPYNLALVKEHELLSNPELAKKLAFQCRVGTGNFHSGKMSHNDKLLKTLVHSLGKSNRGDKGSWWGRILEDDKIFDSATLWLSSNATRTPLHADAKTQFLVQLQGTKHVTVLPHGTKGSPRWEYIAASHGGPLNATLLRAEMSQTGPADEMQQCLLRPGDILWMQAGVEHDVFALDPSLSLNMRFNQLSASRLRRDL